MNHLLKGSETSFNWQNVLNLQNYNFLNKVLNKRLILCCYFRNAFFLSITVAEQTNKHFFLFSAACQVDNCLLDFKMFLFYFFLSLLFVCVCVWQSLAKWKTIRFPFIIPNIGTDCLCFDCPRKWDVLNGQQLKIVIGVGQHQMRANVHKSRQAEHKHFYWQF